MDFLESDLYPPIKEYFEGIGYKVDGEVKNCDVTAVKDGFLVVVEIKKHFNAKLLFQALDRQKFADCVYIAIPKPKRLNKDFTKMIHIAKALNIGFLCVSLLDTLGRVDIIFEPESCVNPRDNKKKRSVVGEAINRNMSANTGGVTKTKIATVYRERCVLIACIAIKEGFVTAKLLKDKYGIAEGVQSVLKRNWHNWFNKIDKGLYEASDAVKNEMENGQFRPLFDFYMAQLEKKTCNEEEEV
ncbi:MAG: DUF2161 family putative PD-(D/E)XK-type phosphodiesterase [Clostridiales bacterium]|jgi:hypothetical protein|nr:DUF2161 family putative PD-(D/E)XK-type phosphodiesterase [Clostridiales bacterium]